MKKFYLFSLLLGMVFGSLALTACGSDDDDSSNSPTNNNGGNPTGGSIVGTWQAFVPASNPESMVYCYDHLLVYAFDSDKTFKINTAAGGGGSIDKFHVDQQWTFYGTYTADNGLLKLKITRAIKKSADWVDVVSGYDAMEMTYQVNGDQLVLGSDKDEVKFFDYHHLLVATLTRLGDAPDTKPEEAGKKVTRITIEGSVNTSMNDTPDYTPQQRAFMDAFDSSTSTINTTQVDGKWYVQAYTEDYKHSVQFTIANPKDIDSQKATIEEFSLSQELTTSLSVVTETRMDIRVGSIPMSGSNVWENTEAGGLNIYSYYVMTRQTVGGRTTDVWYSKEDDSANYVKVSLSFK